jgi:hypothetical protein
MKKNGPIILFFINHIRRLLQGYLRSLLCRCEDLTRVVPTDFPFGCNEEASSETKVLGRKPGSILIRSSTLIAKSSRFGLWSGFISWAVCTFVCKQMQPLVPGALLYAEHTVPSMFDGWIYWGLSGTQCEFILLSLRKHSETCLPTVWAHFPSLEASQPGRGGFRIRRIISMHSPTFQLHRNERFCFNVPHNKLRSLLRSSHYLYSDCHATQWPKQQFQGQGIRCFWVPLSCATNFILLAFTVFLQW